MDTNSYPPVSDSTEHPSQDSSDTSPGMMLAPSQQTISMAQPVVLAVDSDARSLCLLEVGLRQAGYHVTTTMSCSEAIAQAETEIPIIALIDVDLPDGDGFALAGRLREQPGCQNLLVLFLVDPRRPSDRLRAIEVGASDVLDKPVYLKEALWRVETLLEKAAQRGELGGGREGAARFSGTLSGTTILDLLQSMELAQKSGLVHCQNSRGQRGSLYIAAGKCIDAEVGPLRGEDALFRLLTWRDGEYRVDLIDVLRPHRITRSASELIIDAARWLDDWNQLCMTLPPLDTVLLPATFGLGNLPAPDKLPAELQDILVSFNGQRTILDVVELDEELPLDALGRLGAISRLYADRLLMSRVPAAELRRPSMTPPPIGRLTPPPAPRLTPPPMPRMQVPPSPRLTPPPMARLTPPPMARLTPPPMARLTPPPMARLTPPPMARLTPPPMARLTPPPMARLTPPPMARLTPSPAPRLTPSPAPRLTPPPAQASTSALAVAEALSQTDASTPSIQLTIEHSAPTANKPMQPMTSGASLPEVSAEMLPVSASLSSDSQIEPISISQIEPISISQIEPIAISQIEPISISQIEPISISQIEPIPNSAPTLDSLLPPQMQKSPPRYPDLPPLPPDPRGSSSDPAWRSGLMYAPVRPQPAAPPSQFLRHLLTAVVGLGLFGLGIGLYWVFHTLTHSTEPAVATAPAPAPVPRPAAHVTAAPPVTPPAAPPPAEPKLEEPTAPPTAAPAATPATTPPPAPTPSVKAEEPPTAAPPPPAANDGYDALIAKARTALRRGQLSLAKHTVHQAERLRPQAAPALVVEAEAALDEGDADTAGRLARTALKLDPQAADAHIVLGMAAQAQAQSAIARLHFKKYLELAPNGDRAKDVKAFLRSGY